MNKNKKNIKKNNINIFIKAANKKSVLLVIFHSILTLLAVHMAYTRNCKFTWTHTLISIFAPYLYIIYFLATGGSICGARLFNI